MDEPWDALLALLARRDVTAAEAEAALVRLGHSRTRARQAVQKARRFGLLDDARVARTVRDRRTQGVAHGILKVAENLERRGVAGKQAQEALAGVDDRARCREAMKLYVSRRGGPDGPTELRRMLSYLLRQGFQEDSVREALRDQGIELPDDSA